MKNNNMVKVCLPLNLFNNEMLQCGCGYKLDKDNRAYIIKVIDPDEKNIKIGDSALVFCGECVTKNFPEFKDIK